MGRASSIRSEDGFTVIEVLVAALVLVTAALGAFQVMIGSTRTEFRAEQSQVAIDRAQAALEEIRALSYEQVALTAAPSVSQAGELAGRLTGTCASQGVSTDGCFALDADGSDLEPLVVNGGELEEGGSVTGGTVDPTPETFQTGEVSGSIHRFVVWQNDYSCDQSQCPGGQDLKRAVVVVTIDATGSGGDRAYREVQSDFIDPDTGKDVEPTPSPPQEVEAQQLWLSDTRCSETARITPTADHSLHDTLGACAEAAAGAPDLLLTSPPELDLNFPAEAQPEYDFATEVEPVVNPGNDKGLQLRRDSDPGCNFEPTGAGAEQRTHRWVTEEVGAGSSLVLEGSATLELWTQTLEGASGAAEICAFLFVREETTGGAVVDTPIGDADNFGTGHFSYQQNPWQSGGWALESLTMNLQPPSGESNVRVLAGERLGLGVTLRSTSAVDAIQIAYEHPDFDSRLEIETSTPLP